ncbi:MAG TPA: hypothetical protein VKU01_33860 [Bryobacteraceae bacterium]|nr:hypothetical protein [Bryobacteraceae bacterium]
MRVAVLLCFSGLAAASPIYTVTNLGTFGAGASVAYGISATGGIAGWSQSTDAMHAFTSANGAVTDLNGSASESYAYGVNAAGEVAGTAYEAGVSHGVVWSGNGMTDFGAGTAATAINDSGLVVGYDGSAFLYDGSMHDIGVLAGGSWSGAYGVNSQGIVAGYGDTASGNFRGFVWSAATGMLELGTLGGASSYAMAINDAGVVVGNSTTAAGLMHAFEDTTAGLRDLGTLGGTSSYAYGINSAGTVVGYSLLADGTQHAFVYVNGVMVDLNSLVGVDGWVLTAAYGINDAGQIVGTGFFNGQAQAFVLDPGSSTLSTPEPPTATLFLVSALLMGLGIVRLRTAANH